MASGQKTVSITVTREQFEDALERAAGRRVSVTDGEWDRVADDITSELATYVFDPDAYLDTYAANHHEHGG